MIGIRAAKRMLETLERQVDDARWQILSITSCRLCIAAHRVSAVQKDQEGSTCFFLFLLVAAFLESLHSSKIPFLQLSNFHMWSRTNSAKETAVKKKQQRGKNQPGDCTKTYACRRKPYACKKIFKLKSISNTLKSSVLYHEICVRKKVFQCWMCTSLLVEIFKHYVSTWLQIPENIKCNFPVLV